MKELLVAGNNCFSTSRHGQHFFSDLDSSMLAPFLSASVPQISVITLGTKGIAERSEVLPPNSQVSQILSGKWSRGYRRVLLAPWVVLALSSRLKRESVAYARLPSPMGFLLLASAAVRNRKTIVSLHGEPRSARTENSFARRAVTSPLRALMRYLVSRSSLVFTTSPYLAKTYGVSSDSVVTYRGTLLREIPPLSPKMTRDELKLIFVGRLSPEKNPLAAIDLCAALNARSIHSTLDFLGDGPLRLDLEHAADRAGIPTTFHGWESRHRIVQDHISASDYLVLPSRTEGSPKVLLEAMALGTPVCTWNVNEAVSELTGAGGALISDGPDDVAGWVDGISRTWRTDEYDSLRSSGWNAAQGHTIQALTARITACIDEHFDLNSVGGPDERVP